MDASTSVRQQQQRASRDQLISFATSHPSSQRQDSLCNGVIAATVHAARGQPEGDSGEERACNVGAIQVAQACEGHGSPDGLMASRSRRSWRTTTWTAHMGSRRSWRSRRSWTWRTTTWTVPPVASRRPRRHTAFGMQTLSISSVAQGAGSGASK